jgi:ATP-binding cassette subfamily C (CFTR/MRP) protein 10
MPPSCLTLYCICSLSTFGLFALLGRQLSPAIVFTSLALFNVLLAPLNSFPWVINGVVEALVSLRRLEGFLLASNSHSHSTGSSSSRSNSSSSSGGSSGKQQVPQRFAVSIENGSFLAEGSGGPRDTSAAPMLSEISLHVPVGAMVVVTGEVGSGKSLLLQAVLGELGALQGSVQVHGTLAYVAQDPWTMQGTIR